MRRLATRLVRIAARLAPAWARRDFQREWEAEIESAWAGVAAGPQRRARWRVLRHATGALLDAAHLFASQWSFDMLAQDVRYALRLMRQRLGYTAIVIGTLAIGIGANTAMFSLMEGVLLRPLPYKDPSRLVMLWENDRLNHQPRYPLAPANFADWRAQSRGFESVAGWVENSATMRAGGDPFHAAVAVVTTNFFSTLGVAPMLGRGFAPDELPPAQRSIVLSHATWASHFGSDPAIVGRTVTLGEYRYRVIGVMGPSFAFPTPKVDAWRALAESPQLMATRAQHFMSAVARLAPGVGIDQARADLDRVTLAEQQAHPDTNSQRGATIVPLQEAVVGEVRQPMYYLAALVALLLAIACANVANLMLAQGAVRRREIAVRTALGADRLRIVRQLLVEGLLLAVAGGLGGVLLADRATALLSRLSVDYIPRVSGVGLDGRVLAFAAAVSLVSGLVFALAPAVRASRVDVQHDLREGARGTVGGSRLRGALVICEFAAAVVLVVGAALLLRSFDRVLDVDPGFATAGVLTVDTDLPSSITDTDAATRAFFSDWLARISAIPGVRSEGVVNNVPLSGESWTAWITIENRPRPHGEPPEVGYRSASSGYLSAMQIPLLAGRWIADTDTHESMKVVVVNKALVDRFFPDGRALGAHIRLGPNPKAPWATIVGVVGNVHHAGLEEAPRPEAFEAFGQDTEAGPVVVRAEGDRRAIAAAVREAARAVNPAAVPYRMQWMDTVVDDQLAPRRLSLRLVEGFAGVALGLALLGVYGVISYTVAQRAPEIGVRIALGAPPSGIHRMVLADGLRLALPGLAAGTLVAILAARVARSVLFEVSPGDPVTFASVIALVTLVALAACYIPARRAARVDPVAAIRQ